MKTKQLLFSMCIMLFGLTAFAQNPFAEMMETPQYRAIIDADIPTRDQVITDDLIVTFSLCVGNDCANGENFGFDTFRLKENNLRIHFDDTSNSASFPGNDWRLTANDSNNGGENYFAIDDATAGNRPFKVEAGSGANAMVISDSGGNVGLGTADPALELHIADGDSPSVRLEQTGASGFTPQTWDVAGNETNFFIRDVTTSSNLPFRIRAGAPNNALFINTNGSVGLGTASPPSTVSLELTGTTRGLQLNRLTTIQRDALGTALGAAEVGVVVFDTDDGSLYTWDGAAWSSGGAGGTDDQNITGSGFAGNMLTIGIEGGTSEVIDLSSLDDAGTDDQNITGSGFAGNMLTIGIEGGTSEVIDLSSLDDAGTDDQNITGSGLVGNMLTIGIEGGTSEMIDLSSLDDAGTDDQNITGSGLVGNMLTIGIEGGTSEVIDLSSLDDAGTDDQNITGSGFAGNMLTIGIEGGTSEVIDLSSLDDAGTDDQNITGSGFAGNMLTIGIEGGASETVDLSSLDDAGTDDQNIAGSGFAGNILTIGIEGGASETVDLSSLDDAGTDDQNIAGSGLAGNILTIGIEGGASETVDLSSLDNAGSDDQQLTLAGNSLDLENGGSVDLTGYLDNTDQQTLGVNLSGNTLEILISGGNLAFIDLTPIVQPVIDENAAQQIQIDDLISTNAAQQAMLDDLLARLIVLEDCACSPLAVDDNQGVPDFAKLLQNVPNPFDGFTTIGYYIPFNHNKANITITATSGQRIQDIPITQFGEGSIKVDESRLQAAVYFYTLYVDGKRIDTKRMVVK